MAQTAIAHVRGAMTTIEECWPLGLCDRAARTRHDDARRLGCSRNPRLDYRHHQGSWRPSNRRAAQRDRPRGHLVQCRVPSEDRGRKRPTFKFAPLLDVHLQLIQSHLTVTCERTTRQRLPSQPEPSLPRSHSQRVRTPGSWERRERPPLDSGGPRRANRLTAARSSSIANTPSSCIGAQSCSSTAPTSGDFNGRSR